MPSFQQMWSDMDPRNYTFNGEPATLYGLIAVTTLVLGYVTVMESANASEKKVIFLKIFFQKKRNQQL